jgi:hypothetical protein
LITGPLTTAGHDPKDAPMSQIALTLPVRVLTEEGRKTVQRDLARALLSWEGAPDQDIFKSLLWSYLHEQPDGTWGAGGRIMRLADIAGMASN